MLAFPNVVAAPPAVTVLLTRKLYMNCKGDPTGLTKAFIDYLLSPEGAEIVKSCKYIPVKK